MRTPIRLFLIAICATAILWLPGSAAAVVTDPNDVSGKLDLSAVGYTKDGSASPMRVTVRTYPTWPSRLLRPGSENRLQVLLEVDADPERDYVARLRFRAGRLWASIRGEGQSFEPLKARRPNRHTARFTIPGSSPPNPNHGGLRIAAASRFIASAACDPASGGTICVDRAPDSGFGS
jgi:hypothetical protein